jgi:hypothetical protein
VDAPPRARELRHEVPEGLEAVVQTALQKEPERRFQTAEEMAGSLDLVSGGFEAMAAEALRKLLGPRYRWLHGKRLATLVAAALLVLIAGGILLRDVLRRPILVGAYPMYAVLPYQGEELTEEEKRLSREAATELYWHLGDWESISLVSTPALEGPSTRVVQAGFGAPEASLTAGFKLLETLNASHLVYVQARAGGDSVDIEASIHVRESRTTEALRGAGLRTEIELISAGLALQILGLHGEAAEFEDLVRLSPYHVAHQQYREGRNALLDWRLSEAEDHFRSAVEEDSAFALAHYQLAMTMYWRTVRDPERILIGEAIQYHVGRADRFGNEDRLRPGERRDLDAFRAFWAGDYETARNRYAAILEREPTSLDALLLAGAVEFQDPWAATDPEGELAGPRGDWDRARTMFDSAVVLTPHVQLAWGQLFEIDREVARVALKGRCLGFLPPGGPLIPLASRFDSRGAVRACSHGSVADAGQDSRAARYLGESRTRPGPPARGARRLDAVGASRSGLWGRCLVGRLFARGGPQAHGRGARDSPGHDAGGPHSARRATAGQRRGVPRDRIHRPCP